MTSLPEQSLQIKAGREKQSSFCDVKLTKFCYSTTAVIYWVHCNLGHRFFYFLFYRFFSQQVSVGGRNRNINKIHWVHFPIELKSKETRNSVSFNFNSIGNGSNEFYFYFTN